MRLDTSQGFLKNVCSMFFALLEGCLRNISGRIGIHIRRLYYQLRLAKCGKRITISEGVYLDSPRNIEIGDNVWIDRNVIIIAGKIGAKDNIRLSGNINAESEGRVVIGSNSHIGIATIIQGHGGIIIGNNFTTSAYCKLYSLSNDPLTTYKGTMDKNAPAFLNEIRIGNNVWLGLNVSVLSGNIDNDVFIKPNAVINSNIQANQIISSNGQPVSLRFSGTGL